MKTNKEFNDFVYFTFPFINGLKKLLHFLHFELITTFPCLKLNVIITGFVCSNKYVKQVDLINHSWICPTLQRRLGLEFCLFSKRWGEGTFSPKKEKVGKIVEEGSLGRVTLTFFANLCVYNSKKHYDPRYIQK